MTEHLPAQTSLRDPSVDPSEIHHRRPTLSRLRAESRAAIAEILSSLGYPDELAGELEEAQHRAGHLWRRRGTSPHRHEGVTT